jgi:hypothetical protein
LEFKRLVGYFAFATKATEDTKAFGYLGHCPRYFVLFVFYVANNHFFFSPSQQQQPPPQTLREPPHSQGAPFLTTRQAASAARIKTTDTTMIDS